MAPLKAALFQTWYESVATTSPVTSSQPKTWWVSSANSDITPTAIPAPTAADRALKAAFSGEIRHAMLKTVTARTQEITRAGPGTSTRQTRRHASANVNASVLCPTRRSTNGRSARTHSTNAASSFQKAGIS